MDMSKNAMLISRTNHSRKHLNQLTRDEWRRWSYFSVLNQMPDHVWKLYDGPMALYPQEVCAMCGKEK